MAGIKYNKYSIIIPSFNRIDEIKEALQSIQNLKFDRDRFELIIVDDGSTDNTIEFLEDNKSRVNFKLSFFTQKNQGPGAARNTGMENASGDFFIFVDSDCTMPENWLMEIDKLLSEEHADAFGGPDTYRDDFPPVLKAINYSMTSFITTGGLRGKKGKKLAKFYPRSFNMGLRRQLWVKIGGFGSLRHGQDIEFSNRILKSGAKIAYVATAPVFHKRRTNIRRFYKQVFNWGVARINLYIIDHSMLEPLHTLPALMTLISIIICILAPFWEPVKFIFVYGILLAFIILIFSMIDSVRKYKELKPALFLPVIMPAQVFGYGIGFVTNFIRRIVLKKGESVGFKKNYYK